MTKISEQNTTESQRNTLEGVKMKADLGPQESRNNMVVSYLSSLIAYSPEKAMATHFSTLAWKIPWMEEPGGLQSMGSLGVGRDWATSLSLFTFMHWRRNGSPLQCSCLENPRDGGAWWAAVYGVAQSQTWLKRLSSSSSIVRGPDSISLLSKGLSRVFSSSKASILWCSVFFYGPTLTSVHDYWKNQSFDWTDLCWQSNVFAY